MKRLLFLASVLSIGPALADDGLAEKIDRLFQRYDADGDGTITPEELTDQATFQSLDKDADGKITRGDFGEGAAPAKPAGPEKPKADEWAEKGAEKTGRADGQGRLGDVDADGDGRVSEDEFVAHQKKEFARRDKNGDGFLDREEMQAAFRPDGGAGKDGAGKDGAGRGAGLREKVKEMDADGNGSLSREEWKGPAMMFDRLDKDGDGNLTSGELAEGMKDMRGEGGEGKRPGLGDGKRPAIPEKDGAAAPRRPAADPSAMFAKLDADGDGSLSGEEVPGGQLQALDADGDGKVSPVEFAEAPIYKRDR